MPSLQRRTGSCLCGAIRFEVSVPEAKFHICHCRTCRQWSAGPMMAVHCPADASLEGEADLTWYRSSRWAERGFCKRCGSSLFYRLANHPEAMLIVSVEAFDAADDMTLERHIYIDSKPGRYDFADDRARLTEAELLGELGVSPKTKA